MNFSNLRGKALDLRGKALDLASVVAKFDDEADIQSDQVGVLIGRTHQMPLMGGKSTD